MPWSRRATCRATDGHYAKAIPHGELVRLLAQYGRLVKSPSPTLTAGFIGCSASSSAVRSRSIASSTSAMLTDSGGMKRTALTPQDSSSRPL